MVIGMNPPDICFVIVHFVGRRSCALRPAPASRAARLARADIAISFGRTTRSRKGAVVRRNIMRQKVG
jgi:hypothetical protein